VGDRFKEIRTINRSLLTDLYELTMAEGYWKLGMAEREAVFHLMYRTNPFGGGFAICAGLESLVSWIESFEVSESQANYLRTITAPSGQPLLSSDFIDYLANLRLTVDLDAIPEGKMVFAREPLLRVRGPLLQVQLIETVLLNLVNFQTLIATKGARVRLAAGPDGKVVEFGARRAQGMDGAVLASRAAYVGGADATSNVQAGFEYGVPVAGTHAHSWVMAFDSEQEAFEKWAQVMPHNSLFLVDTYETLQGVDRVIEVAKQMVAVGEVPMGIRLDSGDLCKLSIKSRRKLDEAGLTEMKIVASNELDEERIAALRASGAPIDMWGVGTRLATGHPDGALNGIYKLSALRGADGNWRYKVKGSDSPEKATDPGLFQVRRLFSASGEPLGDVVYDVERGLPKTWTALRSPDETEKWSVEAGAWEDLLVPIFRAGKRVCDLPTLAESRKVALDELKRFPSEVTQLKEPESYLVGIEEGVHQARREVLEHVESRSHSR
jgi:nicotinate phosphoribosyltransferase